METTRKFLRSQMGLPAEDLHELPSSRLRFPDGGQYRFEIPSTEGPAALRAVIEEATERGLVIHRVSQGSGIMLLTDEEIAEMARLGSQADMEVCLFVGPRATFDVGAQVYSPAGKTLGLSLRGADQLVYAIEDVKRAVRLGIRSVLVSDLGLLQVLGKMRQAGELPGELIIKTSVMMAPSNPASARLLEDLGANTINIPSDLSLAQIAAIRAAVDAVLDFYIEAPDNIGGFIRYYEAGELIRVASPVYIKLGLRNAPDIYPSGKHLEDVALKMTRERVRRAQIVHELIETHAPHAVLSPRHSRQLLGVPVS